MKQYCETCRKLSLGPWSDGVHATVESCETQLGRKCPAPQEHHEPKPLSDHDFLVVCRQCGLEVAEGDQWLDHGPCHP